MNQIQANPGIPPNLARLQASSLASNASAAQARLNDATQRVNALNDRLNLIAREEANLRQAVEAAGDRNGQLDAVLGAAGPFESASIRVRLGMVIEGTAIEAARIGPW